MFWAKAGIFNMIIDLLLTQKKNTYIDLIFNK